MVARSLPGRSIFSNLYMFGIIRILGDVSRISFLLCSVVLVPTRHSFTIQQSKDSLLRYYFSDACRLRALRGHQGCHHPFASCLGRGRVQNLGGHVFAVCWPTPHHFSPYLHTCTLIRGVCRCSQSLHRHDKRPHQVYHLIPIAQTSLLNSTFPSPPSPLASR